MNFKSLNESLKEISRFLYESEEEEYEKHIEECNNVLKNIGLEWVRGRYRDTLFIHMSRYIPNFQKREEYTPIEYVIDSYPFKKLVSMAPVMEYNKYNKDFTTQQLIEFVDNIKNNIDKVTKIINSDKRLKHFQNLQILGTDLVKQFPQLFKDFTIDEYCLLCLHGVDSIEKFCNNLPKGINCTTLLFPDVISIKGNYYIPTKEATIWSTRGNFGLTPFRKYDMITTHKNIINYFNDKKQFIIDTVNGPIPQAPERKIHYTKPIWRNHGGDELEARVKSRGLVQIVRADEWETGEYTDFEHALWFPQVEPDPYDVGEGNEYSISPTNRNACSLQDALQGIRNIYIAPPKYTKLVEFLKDIEDWAKTGTLDAYLQKHGEELKALCNV